MGTSCLLYRSQSWEAPILPSPTGSPTGCPWELDLRCCTRITQVSCQFRGMIVDHKDREMLLIEGNILGGEKGLGVTDPIGARQGEGRLYKV